VALALRAESYDVKLSAMVDPDDLAREFERVFGRSPGLYHAPGRVNLIGEHTDYNDGFVMPMAIDRSTWVAAAPRDDERIVVRSREYGETIRIDGEAQATQTPQHHHWSDYIRGVGAVLAGLNRRRQGYGGPPKRSAKAEGPRYDNLFSDADRADVARPFQGRGADMLIASDVPIGAGLSSSAALEVAVGYGLLDLVNHPIHLTELALACQRAEHEYAGTRCGIMDQMIGCHGREGHAMMLDTRSLERRWLPLPATVRVLVCNTMVKHEHASGEYNARRADCEAGVAVLARQYPEVRALRDATIARLDGVRTQMSDRVYRRCRHVIAENARVEQAARALVSSDFETFGRLMGASHDSLRDDYEVSCAELDAMVTIASDLDGVYGARMTGGGFGGCAIALADASAADRVQRDIARRYEQVTRVRPEIWICSAGAGVGRWLHAEALRRAEPLHRGGRGGHGGQIL